VRRAAKVDANQPEIVAALRAAGLSVAPLHFVGRGFPDLLVGSYGENILLELKTAKGKLTPDEAKWHEQWRGQVAIARTIADALRLAREEPTRHPKQRGTP
jgi:hypothetical protein